MLVSGRTLNVAEVELEDTGLGVWIADDDAFFAQPVACKLTSRGVEVPPGGSDAAARLVRSEKRAKPHSEGEPDASVP